MKVTRVTLPSGGWVDVLDRPNMRGQRVLSVQIAKLPQAMREVAAEAKRRKEAGEPDLDPKDIELKDEDLSDDDLERIVRMREVTVFAVLAGWSFDRPLTLDNIGLLDPEDFSVIEKIAAPVAADAIAGIDTEVNPGLTPEQQASPTGPSSV